MAHRLEVVTIQQIQSFDQRWSLCPEAGLVNFVAVVIRFYWRANSRVKAGEVFRCDQSAVMLHVIANAAGDWTLGRIMARGDQAGDATFDRAPLLGGHKCSEPAGDIRLNNNVANLLHRAVREKTPFI